MPTESQAAVVKQPRLALLLRVNHLEAIDDGFENGHPFTLVWENPEVFPNEEARTLFLKSMTIIEGYQGGYDYAVYRVVPENIEVCIGPGDYVVVYDDRYYACYVGAGELTVKDGKVVVSR